MYRILPQRGLIRITFHLFGAVGVADAVFIPIHTFVYVLWMGILVDYLTRGLVKEEK